jgi:hypothetical protein
MRLRSTDTAGAVRMTMTGSVEIGRSRCAVLEGAIPSQELDKREVNTLAITTIPTTKDDNTATSYGATVNGVSQVTILSITIMRIPFGSLIRRRCRGNVAKETKE